MKKVNVLLVLVMLVVAGVFVGCTKENEVLETNKTKSVSEEVLQKPVFKIVDGILVFNSVAEADNYINYYLQNIDELKIIEKNNNFKSVQTKFWDILDTQKALYQEYEANYSKL